MDLISQSMKETGNTLEIIKKNTEESSLLRNKSGLVRIQSEQPLHSHSHVHVHHENLLIDFSPKKA